MSELVTQEMVDAAFHAVYAEGAKNIKWTALRKGIEAALNARKPEPGQPAAVPDIKTMVDRFLGWKLPEDFAPDCGIKFQPLDYNGTRSHPIGTNLLTADQAKAMFEFVLAALPKQPAADKDCGRCRGKGWNWLAGAPAHETNKYPCEKCNGTGKVLEQPAAGQSEPVAWSTPKPTDEWSGHRWFTIHEVEAKEWSDKGWQVDELYTRSIPAAPAVPEGWKLVPIEPTDEMVNATFAGMVEDQSVQGQMRRRAEMKRRLKLALAASPNQQGGAG